MSLRVSDFVAVQSAALCAARVAVSAAVSSSEGGIWGVGGPPLPPPSEVPTPEKRGALPPLLGVKTLNKGGPPTPLMDVAVVRQNRASSVTSPSAPPVSCVTPT
jgi:hypothetical protein